MAGLGGLHDRLGRFVRAAAAAPAEPVAEGQAEDDGEAPPSENPRQQTQRLDAELSAVRAELVAAREHRQSLLADGDIAGVEVVDHAIRQLTITFESLQARGEKSYSAALQFDEDERRRGWEALRPRLEAAQAERDELAYELWCAVDRAAAVEGEALAMSVTIASPTPSDGPLTRYLWKIWAENHARRVGLMPRAA